MPAVKQERQKGLKVTGCECGGSIDGKLAVMLTLAWRGYAPSPVGENQCHGIFPFGGHLKGDGGHQATGHAVAGRPRCGWEATLWLGGDVTMTSTE